MFKVEKAPSSKEENWFENLKLPKLGELFTFKQANTGAEKQEVTKTSAIKSIAVSEEQLKYYSEISQIEVPKGAKVQVIYKSSNSTSSIGPLENGVISTKVPNVGYLGRINNVSKSENKAFIIGNYKNSGAEFYIQIDNKYYDMSGKEISNITEILKQPNKSKKSPLEAGDLLQDSELKNLSGKPQKLRELITKGDLTVIDFWAEWCDPCREGMPKLVKIVKENSEQTFKYSSGELAGKGLKFLSILIDGESNDPRNILKKIEVNEKDHIHLDGREIGMELIEKYSVNSFPYSILVDGKGNIIARFDQNSGMHIEDQLKSILTNLK